MNFNNFSWIFHNSGYLIPPLEAKNKNFTPIELPFDEETILGVKKVKGVLWLVAHCVTQSKRELAVKELAKYV